MRKAEAPRPPVVPRPEPLGTALLVLTALAFLTGLARNETAAFLTGAVFLAVEAWCFAAVLVTGLVQRKRVGSLSARILTQTVNAGDSAELELSRGAGERRFRLPAALVRYELALKTKDGRELRHLFDPDRVERGWASFPVEKRGAYYGEADALLVRDAAGLFRLAFPIAQSAAPRLLAVPAAAPVPPPLDLRSGGTARRNEAHYQKTDDLIGHRPYLPGDDPRRINWKLYGHAGGLFVREGEPEPPPHSRLLILVDTEADPGLYTREEARRSVDLLCENALAAGLELGRQGVDVLTGFTGGGILGGTEAELAAALAWPAALTLPSGAELPQAALDRGVVILALPRNAADGPGESALDKFLRKRPGNQETGLLFLHDGESKRSRAAETGAVLYNRKPRVHAAKWG